MYGIFLDIETTGLNAAVHRPIDIAFKIIDLSTGFLKGEYQSVVKQSLDIWEKKDSSSIKVNGFTYEEISRGKDPQVVGTEIKDLFEKAQIQRGAAMFICQNPSFDRGFFNQLIDVYTQERLNWPYHWLDFASMYWTMIVLKAKREGGMIPEKISLSKNDIAIAYNLPVESNPHRALNGVNHLILCYQAVLGVNFNLNTPPESSSSYK